MFSSVDSLFCWFVCVFILTKSLGSSQKPMPKAYMLKELAEHVVETLMHHWRRPLLSLCISRNIRWRWNFKIISVSQHRNLALPKRIHKKNNIHSPCSKKLKFYCYNKKDITHREPTLYFTIQLHYPTSKWTNDWNQNVHYYPMQFP